MPSFFEKLKKGMGIEIPTEEKVEERIKKEEKKGKRPKKTEAKTKEAEFKVKEVGKPKEKIEVKEEMKEEVKIKKPSLEEKKIPFAKATEDKEKWLEPEGQLAVDVYQTESELVIQSAIAGVRPEDLDISIEREIITIEGERKKPFEEAGDYFTQECYWGKFSRKIILPVEVNPDKVEAFLKEGILTIRMPKILKEKKRRITIKG